MNARRNLHECVDAVAKVASGWYSIGSNNIPNASPIHRRELQQFWIDRCVVTLGHYERFVVGDGYYNRSLWPHLDDHQPPRSIDERCHEIALQSRHAIQLFRKRPKSSDEIPLVGVTWMEADAIARFAGGRLPYESEWEVSMTRSKSTTPSAVSDAVIAECWRSAPISDWGCVLATNLLQEWTADPFTQRYWRADGNEHGMYWTPADAYGVSLRGSSKSDMHKDYRFRRSANPDEVHAARGFRRVWESEPSEYQCASSFVHISKKQRGV